MISCSYHSPPTLRNMTKYQIGRVSDTWVNFTPPIRGGLFRRDVHKYIESTLTSSTTMNTGTGSASEVSERYCSPSNNKSIPSTTPQHGVDNTLAVERALDDDLRDYPSVDQETQQGIVTKYRELHGRVKTEGYYDCRYREYAKELFRYITIFAVFLACLHAGWYITSASFLGLFWVRVQVQCR